MSSDSPITTNRHYRKRSSQSVTVNLEAVTNASPTWEVLNSSNEEDRTLATVNSYPHEAVDHEADRSSASDAGSKDSSRVSSLASDVADVNSINEPTNVEYLFDERTRPYRNRKLDEIKVGDAYRICSAVPLHLRAANHPMTPRVNDLKYRKRHWFDRAVYFWAKDVETMAEYYSKGFVVNR